MDRYDGDGRRNRFDGHRVYNGCPDATLQAEWDHLDALEAEMKSICPHARITWFPGVEPPCQGYDVCVVEPWGKWTRCYDSVFEYDPVSRGLMYPKEAALTTAIQQLKEGQHEGVAHANTQHQE